LDDIELARLRATQLAIVFQSENLWPVLSARENVALVLRLAGVRDARAAAEDALGEFGLRERGGHVTGTLSGGEQQRVAIAAAFARKASLVLADEPTGELDPANEQIVLEALQHLRAQHSATVVLVTHSETVSASADRVIEMKDGRIL
jgi:putative ABC transport system ATP-binding protein